MNGLSQLYAATGRRSSSDGSRPTFRRLAPDLRMRRPFMLAEGMPRPEEWPEEAIAAFVALLEESEEGEMVTVSQLLQKMKMEETSDGASIH